MHVYVTIRCRLSKLKLKLNKNGGAETAEPKNGGQMSEW